MEKECKKHGLTEHVLDNKNNWRCKKCRVEAVTNWRRRLKLKAVAYKGGSCVLCGYNRYVGNLEFHHLYSNKDFSLSESGITRSWERVKKELDKCVMLCSNCHKEVHAGIAQLVERHTVNMKDGRVRVPLPAQITFRCIECGIEIDKKALRCSKCNSLNKRKVKNRPSKEQVQKEVIKSSYSAVGRKYGVSDNAIRKWLK